MNRVEAFKILELSSDSSEEEIKKKFRKLAKEKHPDVNKEPGAEESYKKISEAFEYLKIYKDEPEVTFNNPQSGINLEDWVKEAFRQQGGFGGFDRQEFVRAPEPIQTSTSISFEESVLGCAKTIEIERQDQCSKCSGMGMCPSSDSCPYCQGKGVKVQNQSQGNHYFQYVMECNSCNKTGKILSGCIECNKKGYFPSKSSLDIKVPGGILNGQTIRLQGAGNKTKANGVTYASDIFVTLSVKPDKDMRLIDGNVISKIEISLKEALEGTTKKVRTVLGETDLEIKPKIRHTDQLILKKYGIEKKGNHLFVVDIKYPNDVSKLIEILKEG